MLKTLVVVAVVLLLAALVYRLLRPVIKLARQLIATVRHFQQVTSTPVRPKATAEKLIKCETCGTWIPESRMLTAGSLTYCSRDCLKQARVKPRRNTAA